MYLLYNCSCNDLSLIFVLLHRSGETKWIVYELYDGSTRFEYLYAINITGYIIRITMGFWWWSKKFRHTSGGKIWSLTTWFFKIYLLCLLLHTSQIIIHMTTITLYLHHIYIFYSHFLSIPPDLFLLHLSGRCIQFCLCFLSVQVQLTSVPSNESEKNSIKPLKLHSEFQLQLVTWMIQILKMLLEL